ncbi:hypothetical protein GGR53DRAFT_464728 [Hypoxylon sp. FL1150]|nr:hypothetical protein GGR53DRAFT_464728 [Hypoxylon sp. FL1150]
MLTPAYCKFSSFFYPIGNAPAVFLTQDIPPGARADILLLGGGDVRSTLFTSHVDARPMDITCCDNQRAVIARNILLFSLIIDDDGRKNEESIGCIYFHLYLDQKARSLLRLQAKKLLKLSTTLDTWQQSQYGSRLGFCDSATLSDVRKMWELYSLEQEGDELSQFQRLIELALEKAMEYGKARGFGPSYSPHVSELRSVLPASSGTVDDFDRLCRHFGKHWSTELKADIRADARHPNPMFLTLKDDAMLYCGCNPLDGFHLITPYVSSGSGSQLLKPNKGMSRLKLILGSAKKEFSQWASSYRKHSSSITIRFFVGEALSFAHTLQHKRTMGANTAGWHRSQHRPGPLVLDGLDYLSGNAPFVFDVIDASNLFDHLSPLTLLTAASPLLRNSLTSTLYTEFTAVYRTNRLRLLDCMLCNQAPTTLALLGLFPVDYWTNAASFSSADEDLLNRTTDPFHKLFMRTTWKRPVVMRGSLGPQAGLVTLQFDARQLAHVLYRVYVNMFYQENVNPDPNLEYLQPIPRSMHQRAAFASFVGLVKTRVECDWSSAMNILLNLIAERPGAPKNLLRFQELIVYFHMLDIFSLEDTIQWSSHCAADWLPIQAAPSTTPSGASWGDLRDWKNIPPVVCVTLKIPRAKLHILLKMETSPMFDGTPVYCSVGDAHSPKSNRRHMFDACQLAFGEVSTIGTNYSDSFELSITEDEAGWRGSSALAVSFYVPSCSLLLQPRKTVISFGFEFLPKTPCWYLGTVSAMHETILEDSANVYVTRYAPGQAKLPIIQGFAETDFTDPSVVNIGTKFSLSVGVDLNAGAIESMIGRFDITSPEYQSTLQDCKVQASTESPYQVAITLGRTPSFTVAFPVFVTKNLKTRVARKSCYVEVIAPVATNTEWTKHPNFMYPIHLVEGKPANWNMPYLNLKYCPVIDSRLITKFDWFVPHVDLSGSSREKNASLTRTLAEEARSGLKGSIVTILTESRRRRVFNLCHPFNPRSNRIMIFPSDIRVDHANRTVVLDCAILPLHTELTAKLAGKLPWHVEGQCYHTAEFLHIWMEDFTMELFKHFLPACVERCRTWEHRDDCEYASSSSVPLSVEPDKPFLCTCGDGIFPAKFTDLENWGELSKHAVRAAISPAFWAPYVDEVYRRPEEADHRRGAKGGVNVGKASTDGCATCGKAKKDDGTLLFVCGRCKKVKYCSHACQKADWGVHKALCKDGRNGS